MQTQTTIKLISAALLSLLISACGGGDSSQLDNYESSSSTSSASNGGGSSGNSSSSSSIDTTTPQKIGFGSGDDFQDGVINKGIGDASLSAGGTTELTINIVSGTNTLVTSSIDVTFSSDCVAAGKAKFTNAAGTELTTVSAFNGALTINYTANGCVGNDSVRASANIGGTTRHATTTIDVESDTVGSIKFIDATPEQISIAGTGDTETSVVRFQVLGSTGAPVQNEEVRFNLDVTTGGITLVNPTPASSTTAGDATTNANGYASITVKSGTVPSAVRVTATALSTNITTQSSSLLISTGLPDQDSMSISASVFNPSGWDHDGEISNITIRMADAFNNPVPNGTAVTFTTEGGAIGDIETGAPVSGCFTTNGACTVQWISQNPRPTDGRVTILATAIGNESFEDTDGDYTYDLGELVSTDDLPEAFLDKNENSTRDPGEFFVDIDGEGAYSFEDGKYNGILCKDEATNNCTKTSVTVRDALVLTMSSDAPDSSGGLLIGQPENINLALGQSTSFTVILQDIHGNAMPMGTKIAINSATVSNVTVNHNMPSSGTANTTNPTSFTVTLKASDSQVASGSFDIQVQAPYLTTSWTTTVNQ